MYNIIATNPNTTHLLIVSYVDCSNSNMTCLIYRLHDTAQLNGLISKLYPVK